MTVLTGRASDVAKSAPSLSGGSLMADAGGTF
jgi:hypothetical protein